MNENLFMQLIEELKDKAASQNNTLTYAQIHESMKELQLPEDKLQAVYTYLQGERIKISDEIENKPKPTKKKKMAPVRDSSRLNIQETEIYRTYMSDLETIIPCELEEIEKLCTLVQNGDEMAKSRLVEGSLSKVAQYAKKYVGKGVPITDLIQEANMALMLYIMEAKSHNYWEALETEVDRALEMMIDEYQGSNSIKEKIADRANRLLKVSAELADELEREPTLEELAQKLHISEDEVRTVMKHSISAMNINESSLS